MKTVSKNSYKRSNILKQSNKNIFSARSPIGKMICFNDATRVRINFLDRKDDITTEALKTFRDYFEEFSEKFPQEKITPQDVISLAKASGVILHDASQEDPALLVHYGFPEKAFRHNFQWGQEIRLSPKGPVFIA